MASCTHMCVCAMSVDLSNGPSVSVWGGAQIGGVDIEKESEGEGVTIRRETEVR
jgi:hypothetical protein